MIKVNCAIKTEMQGKTITAKKFNDIVVRPMKMRNDSFQAIGRI